MQRFLATCARHLVPLFGRRRWKRLASAIEAYGKELECRAARNLTLKNGLDTIKVALESARTAVVDGDVDGGWRHLLTAQRLELFYMETEELRATELMMRREASKLDGWRKDAVLELIGTEEPRQRQKAGGEAQPGGQAQPITPELARVFRAALIRDEHYHNQAYKDGLRRSTFLLLSLILPAVVLALVAMSAHEYFACPASGSCKSFQRLLSMVVVGLLGATVSAMTDWPKNKSGSTKIPEAVSSVRVTILRLMMGPAAAIVLYFVVHSEFYGALFKGVGPNGYGVLVVAFVAGFSERLVLRVVEAVAGKS